MINACNVDWEPNPQCMQSSNALNNEMVTWLINQLGKMELTGNITKLIRLDFPPRRDAVLLVTTFVHSAWNHRSKKSHIRTDIIERRWILEKENREAGKKE